MRAIRVLVYEGSKEWICKTLEKSYIQPDSPKHGITEVARLLEDDKQEYRGGPKWQEMPNSLEPGESILNTTLDPEAR